MTSLDELGKKLSDSLVIQMEKQCQLQANFHKKLEAYNSEQFNLTNKQIDSLVSLIASGKNTYKDIQDAFPWINSPTMCYYLVDAPKSGPDQFASMELISIDNHQTYFQFKEIPDDFFYLYEFKPTDTFELNISGENRLYELQKEQESLKLTKQSIASADAAVFWAKISVIISIVLFVLGKLLN